MSCVMKRLTAFILFISVLTLKAQSFTEKINAAVQTFVTDTILSSATIGICVKDVKTNQIIIDYNANKNFVPASLQKIPLSVIALETFGTNYTFKTYFLCSSQIQDSVLNGNLYIVGGGDPTLGSVRFAQTKPDTIYNRWYNALKEKGIKHVNGNIYIVSGFFDNYPLNDTWMWGDVGNYYGAGIYALSWHENMFSLYIQAADSITKKNIISNIYPPLPPDYTILNNSLTVKKGMETYLSVYGDHYSKQREVCGTLAIDKSYTTIKGALPFPEYVCAWNFKNYLHNQGIPVSGSIYYTDTLNVSTDTLYINASPSMLTIINHINKTSNNVYAEAVLKLLGKGSYTVAITEMKNKLKRMGLAVDNIKIADGCGLSSVNFISPVVLCDILSYVSTKSYYKQYMNTLSEAGVSGTLRNILKKKPKGCNIYAKSGTMTGVIGYAGYAIHSNGNTYSFTIIVNNFSCKSAVVKEKMEKLMLSLIE